MARNEEKAQAMLNKWVTMKKQLSIQGNAPDKRPYLASECGSLVQAERWRRQIVRETTRKISEIQNAGMGEHRIRDLNDTINRLLRERHHWDMRIVELGGPNYAKSVRIFDGDGRELPGSGGYKYFGAARELPGVRELFQKTEAEPPRRTRSDMYKNITPDYYGYRDEEDGILVKKEAEAEKVMTSKAVELWREEKRARKDKPKVKQRTDEDDDDADLLKQVEESFMAQASAVSNASVTSHVPVISQEDIREAILAKKKADLKEQIEKGNF
mmetsp:Transcript_20887/g.30988  ORF Transcript_20887/g.30988 Transcript_20887/m.30988 type:complete len:271 (+) Transcript_20887:34-846(+)